MVDRTIEHPEPAHFVADMAVLVLRPIVIGSRDPDTSRRWYDVRRAGPRDRRRQGLIAFDSPAVRTRPATGGDVAFPPDTGAANLPPASRRVGPIFPIAGFAFIRSGRCRQRLRIRARREGDVRASVETGGAARRTASDPYPTRDAWDVCFRDP